MTTYTTYQRPPRPPRCSPRRNILTGIQGLRQAPGEGMRTQSLQWQHGLVIDGLEREERVF